MEETDFVSRILIIKDDEILFDKRTISDSIYNEIYFHTKEHKIKFGKKCIIGMVNIKF